MYTPVTRPPTMLAWRRNLLTVIAMCAWVAIPIGAAYAADGENVPHSLLKTYCLRCHNADKRKGEVDLSTFAARPDSLEGRKVWRKVLEQLRSEEMPPEDPQPSEEERRELAAWAERGLLLDKSIKPHPGRVTIP